MQRQVYHHHSNSSGGIDWSRLKDRLIYLPGAIVLAYGLWLSLTF